MVRPFRGDVTAAGAVALAALQAVLAVRGDGLWWATAPCALLLALLAAGAGGERRAYHAALELSAFAALGIALHEAGLEPGVTAAGLAGAGLWFGLRLESPPMLLLGAVAVGASALLLVGRTPWPLLVLALVCALGTIGRRDRKPDLAEALAEAGGLAVAGALLLAAGAGWQVLGAAAGFGLVALGGVERRRGMVLVGLLVLGLWVRVAGAGWLVPLGIAAVAFLVLGLRPARELPPDPEEQDAGPGARVLGLFQR